MFYLKTCFLIQKIASKNKYDQNIIKSLLLEIKILKKDYFYTKNNNFKLILQSILDGIFKFWFQI